VISDHSQGKPILVFAATRNLCIKAAASLVKSYQTAKDTGRRLPWSVRGRTALSCENKQLDEYSEFGVAFHHGGLSLEDRRKVETAFRAGKIAIIVATSTLAVGVNLPAHTVILAGTYQWSGSGMISLTDLDVSLLDYQPDMLHLPIPFL
jgi:ATP-dependent DNA helicase HFM1/MER3